MGVLFESFFILVKDICLGRTQTKRQSIFLQMLAPVLVTEKKKCVPVLFELGWVSL